MKLKVGHRSGSHSVAFTLVELLTVIAIIAILAAIIFPVFATVRENGRRTNAMEHMSEISRAMTAFKLEKGTYPTVLFGYAYKGLSMSQGYAQAKKDYQLQTYFPGLFPNFVDRDVDRFMDMNNQFQMDSTATVTVPINVLCPNVNPACAGKPYGTLVTVTSPPFYKADAFDVSPQIISNNSVNTNNYLPRYQLAWTSQETTGGPPNSTDTIDPITKVNDFNRQLINPAAPGDTYVTCDTSHVQYGKVLVLFLDGHTRAMDTSQFVSNENGSDPTDISVSGDASTATFWHVTPAGL